MVDLHLYDELASWWPLVSHPDDYKEDARDYRRALEDAATRPIREVLELGAGGGNTASHLKAAWRMTLVDRAPGMLEVSRALNPECEHIEGDMRTVRLDRTFDAVFIHDAISYLVTEDELRAAIQTAHAHCRPGGAALFVPDVTKESYRPRTSHGGRDDVERSLRYLDWTFDPDPGDTHYLCHMVYVLRQSRAAPRVLHDEHVLGLFPESAWLRWIEEAGFEAQAVRCESEDEPPEGGGTLFLGRMPA